MCHVSCYTSAALTLLRLCCFLRFWSLRRGLFLFVVCVCCWVVLAVLCVCGCWVGLHRLVRCVVDLCVLCSFFRRRFCVARVGDVRWSGGVWRGRGWRVLVSGGTVCARVVRCSWVWGGRGGAGGGRGGWEGCAGGGMRVLVACGVWSSLLCGGYTGRRQLSVGVSCVRFRVGACAGCVLVVGLAGGCMCGDGGPVLCAAVGLARRCWGLSARLGGWLSPIWRVARTDWGCGSARFGRWLAGWPAAQPPTR